MPPPGPRRVLIAGLGVALTGVNTEAFGFVNTALGAGSAANYGTDLALHCHPGGVDVPNREPDQTVQHLSYWVEGDRQIVSTGREWYASVSPGRAVLDPGRDGGVRGVHALLLPTLAVLMAQKGLCLAHAGAFLDERGGAVLVLGTSGQGKSTLITAALTEGRVVLGDDLAVLRLDGDDVFVSGVPQPLALPADLAHESAVGREIQGDPRQRHAPAQATALDPGWHRLSSVTLVEHSRLRDGHLTRAAGRDAFHRLLTSTPDGLSENTARYAFPFAAAVAKAPAWTLGHAREARVRVGAARLKLADMERLDRAA